jgi:hypothetical protein
MRPPVDLVEGGFLQGGELLVPRDHLRPRFLRRLGKPPLTLRRHLAVLHQAVLELMLLQRYLEFAAQRVHSFMALAHPLRTELADQIGVLEGVRKNPPADPAAAVENGHFPASRFQLICGGQTSQAGTDDDARLGFTLGEYTA